MWYVIYKSSLDIRKSVAEDTKYIFLTIIFYRSSWVDLKCLSRFEVLDPVSILLTSESSTGHRSPHQFRCSFCWFQAASPPLGHLGLGGGGLRTLTYRIKPHQTDLVIPRFSRRHLDVWKDDRYFPLRKSQYIADPSRSFGHSNCRDQLIPSLSFVFTVDNKSLTKSYLLITVTRKSLFFTFLRI